MKLLIKLEYEWTSIFCPNSTCPKSNSKNFLDFLCKIIRLLIRAKTTILYIYLYQQYQIFSYTSEIFII